MGRKGSNLVPFMKEGLVTKKYGSCLVYVDEEARRFKLSFPRISDLVILKNPESLQIIKDWNAIKQKNLRSVISYSNAKQAFLMALKGSDYFQLESKDGSSATYRFLTKDETEAKKRQKKSKNKIVADDIDYSAPQSAESPSYGSQVDSPTSLDHSVDENPVVSPTNSNKYSDYGSERDSEKFDQSFILENQVDLTTSNNQNPSFDVMPAKNDVTIDLPNPVPLDGSKTGTSADFEEQWKKQEEYTDDEKVDRAVKLFQVVQIVDISNEMAMVVCKVVNPVQNAEFLEDFPGIIADNALLEKLKYYRVSERKLLNDDLLLFLKRKIDEECCDYIFMEGNFPVLCGSDHFFVC